MPTWVLVVGAAWLVALLIFALPLLKCAAHADERLLRDPGPPPARTRGVGEVTPIRPSASREPADADCLALALSFVRAASRELRPDAAAVPELREAADRIGRARALIGAGRISDELSDV